mgnify:FL=1|tara:strand:+ start:622 stop:1230 length:609 start_codon:yes stop_codon:yes gene_type:complete
MKRKLSLIFGYVFMLITQPASAEVPNILSEMTCEVTHFNIIDTKNVTPQIYSSYIDSYEAGDFLRLSIELSNKLIDLGVGFHVLLTDEKRDTTVFSALTSLKKPPVTGEFRDGMGIFSKSFLDERINYSNSSIYADGKSWGIMPLTPSKAQLSLIQVGDGLYRGTLIFLPTPQSNDFMFEFSQLECQVTIDSLDKFVSYYAE